MSFFYNFQQAVLCVRRLGIKNIQKSLNQNIPIVLEYKKGIHTYIRHTFHISENYLKKEKKIHIKLLTKNPQSSNTIRI